MLNAAAGERGCLEKYLEALDNPASSLGSQLSDVLKRGDCSRQDFFHIIYRKHVFMPHFQQPTTSQCRPLFH